MANQKTTKGFRFYMNGIAEFIGIIMAIFMPGSDSAGLHKAYGYGFIGFVLLITLTIIRSYFTV